MDSCSRCSVSASASQLINSSATPRAGTVSIFLLSSFKSYTFRVHIFTFSVVFRTASSTKASSITIYCCNSFIRISVLPSNAATAFLCLRSKKSIRLLIPGKFSSLLLARVVFNRISASLATISPRNLSIFASISCHSSGSKNFGSSVSIIEISTSNSLICSAARLQSLRKSTIVVSKFFTLDLTSSRCNSLVRRSSSR